MSQTIVSQLLSDNLKIDHCGNAYNIQYVYYILYTLFLYIRYYAYARL